MSTAEIIHELPKLAEADRRAIREALLEIANENPDVALCNQAASEGAIRSGWQCTECSNGLRQILRRVLKTSPSCPRPSASFAHFSGMEQRAQSMNRLFQSVIVLDLVAG
jgi:hypothetical protein